jgi:hypothetical protein
MRPIKSILTGISIMVCLNGFTQIEGDVFGPGNKGVAKMMILAVDSVSKKQDTAWSDRRGFYYFTGLKPGKYKLIVKADGYDLYNSEYIVVTAPPPHMDPGTDTYYAIRHTIILIPRKPPG